MGLERKSNNLFLNNFFNNIADGIQSYILISRNLLVFIILCRSIAQIFSFIKDEDCILHYIIIGVAKILHENYDRVSLLVINKAILNHTTNMKFHSEQVKGLGHYLILYRIKVRANKIQ